MHCNKDEKKSTTLDLSVVIPCYNEQEVLSELYSQLNATLKNSSFIHSYEVILVNDGSRDETWPMILQFSQENPSFIGLNLSRNFGHQIALTAGLNIAKGEMVLVLDADLQDPPELLDKMVEVMKTEQADVVFGQRSKRLGEGIFKKVTATFFYRFLNLLTDIEIPKDTGDFRLMTQQVNRALCEMPEKQRFIRGMVAWLGFKQIAFTYERQERFAGETKYPLRKMIKFAVDAITAFSINPIRISVYFSLLFFALGLALTSYVIVSYFMANTIPGWASLGAIITVLASGQFIVLAIVGEYVGRIYIESKNRPLYFVKEITSSKES